MKITSYQVTAALSVAVNTDSALAPDASGLNSQLQAAITSAMQGWQDRLRGAVIAGNVTVSVSTGQPMAAVSTSTTAAST
jgi:hypothetical protein